MLDVANPHTPEHWDARCALSASNAEMVGWSGMDFNAQEAYAKALLSALIRPGQRILDVGCGYGRFAQHVINCGGDWTGIDFSTAMFAKFMALNVKGQTSYQHCNALTPDDACFVLGKFDLIFCIGGWKTLGFPSRAAFEETYTPHIQRPGHILTIDCYESHITNLWGL